MHTAPPPRPILTLHRPPSTPAPMPVHIHAISSEFLFGDHREVLIAHGDYHYRLRKTRLGKLILTK